MAKKTSKKAASVTRTKGVSKKNTPGAPRTKVKLLSGGNPQITKADGDAPVQAYIDAMSGGGEGWKRDFGRRLDALIVRTVPEVKKAVRWNSPFYGMQQDDGKVAWFLSVHCVTKYVKVAFFGGALLRPMPPEASKMKNVRYYHFREGDEFDEALIAGWVKQATEAPGAWCF